MFASLIAGLFVAVIQFILAWNSYRANEKINTLKIKDVLLNRDNREFYENYIKEAEESILMMGVTGSRFMDHFANTDPNADQRAKVLIKRLKAGVNVKILVPLSNHLDGDDKKKAEMVESKYKDLESEYPNFECRYFNHQPTHSVFKVDNECIVGPVFPGVSSKYTPAIYLKSTSSYAKKYLDYFNAEWKESNVIKKND